MPKFGNRSKELRAYLCKDLRYLVDEVIKFYDFSIVETFRDKAEQEKVYLTKHSKAKFGQSAHNYHPAYAVDVYPYPCPKKNINGVLVIDDNSPEWGKMINVFKSVAQEMGIDITCGIDFKSFRDAPHIEIADWKKRVKEL